MTEGSSIDWGAVYRASEDGRLMEVLVKLPRERWTERNNGGCGYTLLHYACQGPNVAAVKVLLQSGLVDVNARNKRGNTPAHSAATCRQPRVLEVLLCAAGADLRARGDFGGYTPIDRALWNAHKDGGESVRVLVANGVRLRTVHTDRLDLITPELEAFERGVLRCRSAVVAMLRVKRAGKLMHWDKFLLREIAFAIWSTRYDTTWQFKRNDKSVFHSN